MSTQEPYSTPSALAPVAESTAISDNCARQLLRLDRLFRRCGKIAPAALLYESLVRYRRGGK